jgi:hypothetical protein
MANGYYSISIKSKFTILSSRYYLISVTFCLWIHPNSFGNIAGNMCWQKTLILLGSQVGTIPDLDVVVIL